MSGRAWSSPMRTLCWLGMAVFGTVGCTSEPGPMGGGEVEQHELSFVDPSRETPALGDLAGAPERRLDVVVQVQAEEDPGRPLVILAHGHEGDPAKLERFAYHIAGAGYAVAAVRFPASHEGSGAGTASVLDLAHQPGDLAFVLDQLQDLVGERDHELHRRFDADRVAAIGHSLGGITVLGWTRYEAPDPRVGATVLVAPAMLFGGTFGRSPEAAGPETLIVHGALDGTLPPEGSVELFETLEAPASLVLLAGAGHSDLVEDPQEPPIPARDAAQRATLAFLDEVFHRREHGWWNTLQELQAEGHDVRVRP